MPARRSIRRIPALAAGVIAGSVIWPILADAILVRPAAVFIDHRARSADLYLVNGGDRPEEVSVELRFGYPDADSAGDAYIRFFETAPAGARSAAEWVRAVPPSVVVPPGARRRVRLVAAPPAGLPDGEYWSRIVVGSRRMAPPGAPARTRVSGRIDVAVRTVIALFYRKGAVRTGLALRGFTAALRGDSLELWMDLAGSGDAAWLGTAKVSLADARDRAPRGEWDTQLAVYAPVRRRLAFPVGPLAPGAYTVRLLLSTSRDDIPRARILPAPAIERTAAVTVAAR